MSVLESGMKSPRRYLLFLLKKNSTPLRLLEFFPG